MNINWILKTAIAEPYGLPVVASGHLAIRDSYIVRGHVEPSPRERKVLKRPLGRREDDESSRT
jgi:hypothetical protein